MRMRGFKDTDRRARVIMLLLVGGILGSGPGAIRPAAAQDLAISRFLVDTPTAGPTFVDGRRETSRNWESRMRLRSLNSSFMSDSICVGPTT